LKAKIINFKVLLGIPLTLVCFGLMGSFLRPSIQPDEVLPSRFGDVYWNHDFHARMEDISNCTVCHHTEQQGTINPRPCSDCHTDAVQQTLITPDLFMEVEAKKYEGDNGPPLMKALHNKCIGCHRAMDAGPLVCGDCHTQKFTGVHGQVTWDHRNHARGMVMDKETGLDGNCLSCHHQDKKATSDKDYRACHTCHKPVVSHEENMKMETGTKDHKDYKHGECQKCHTLFNPEDDPVSCQECHKGIKVDTEVGDQASLMQPSLMRPSLEQAVHGKCAECHNVDYPELTGDMPVTCDDCHKPDPSWIDRPGVQPMLWDHEAHSDYKKVNCQTCHHTDSPGESHVACAQCHGTGLFDNPSVEKILKEKCLKCHEEEKIGLDTWESLNSEKAVESYYKYESEEGSFWWNHRGHAIDYSFSCQNCHHYLIKRDGQPVMAKRAKVEWPQEANNIQTCRNCHGAEGPVVGSAAEGSNAPKVDSMYKKICLECHQRLEGGPQTWDDFFKVEPIDEEPNHIEVEELDQ